MLLHAHGGGRRPLRPPVTTTRPRTALGRCDLSFELALLADGSPRPKLEFPDRRLSGSTISPHFESFKE